MRGLKSPCKPRPLNRERPYLESRAANLGRDRSHTSRPELKNEGCVSSNPLGRRGDFWAFMLRSHIYSTWESTWLEPNITAISRLVRSVSGVGRLPEIMRRFYGLKQIKLPEPRRDCSSVQPSKPLGSSL